MLYTSDISTMYNSFFHCHKNTQINTLRFESKQLLSSGENTSPGTQLIKNLTGESRKFHLAG
jgi:hypothetical protein